MKSNYPLGAEENPSAPFNIDIPSKSVEVTVSLTLSKTMKIRTTNYRVLNSGKDEDGEYFEDIEFGDLKSDVERAYLPHEAYMFTDDKDIKKDLEGWNVDDFVVNIEG